MTKTGTLTLDPPTPKGRAVLELPPEDAPHDEAPRFLRDRPAFHTAKVGME